MFSILLLYQWNLLTVDFQYLDILSYRYVRSLTSNE